MHLKDDFGGGPISQVPASWFNSVAKFINNLIPGDGIVFTKNCDGSATVIALGDKLNQGQQTWTDNSSASEEGSQPETFGLTFTDWTKGTGAGLKLRLYGLVEDDGGSHILQPVDIEIAPNGIVNSVKVPQGSHGIFVGA